MRSGEANSNTKTGKQGKVLRKNNINAQVVLANPLKEPHKNREIKGSERKTLTDRPRRNFPQSVSFAQQSCNNAILDRTETEW